MDGATKQWIKLRVFRAHPQCNNASCAVQFDPTGQRLATTMYNGNADSAWKVWGVEAG
jgi:hypothetical protein